MKAIASLLSVVVILSVAAWAEPPASKPAASQPTNSPRDSQPVQVNGVDFQIVARTVWVLPDGNAVTSIPLALKITNHSDKALQFDLCDTVSVHVRDASGKELNILVRLADQLKDQLIRPLLVDKGQSVTIDRTAKLKLEGKAYDLSGPDGAGGVWSFVDLKPGRCTVSFAYESTQAAADILKKTLPLGNDPFWIGKVTTKDLAVEILDRPVNANAVVEHIRQMPARQATLDDLVKKAPLIVVAKVVNTDPNTGKPIVISSGEKYDLVQVLKTLKGGDWPENPATLWSDELRLQDGNTYVLFLTGNEKRGLLYAMKQTLLDATDQNIEMVTKEIKAQAAAAQPVATQPATRPVDANAVAELIRHLGDKDFKVREESTKKLIEMGVAVVPLLNAKLTEQGFDPEVATRIQIVLERPRETQPVREGGVDFQIVGPVVWVLAEGASVPLALKITNRTGQAQFDLCDAISVHMRDAAGRELSTQVRRDDRTAIPKPLLVGKDQSGIADRTAKLKRTDTGFCLTGWDGAGRWWWFEDLKAGRYTVSFTYESTQAAADLLKKTIPVGNDPFWIGKVTTKELTVEIVDAPTATTQPAVK